VISVVPGLTPVTNPVDEPMVATAVVPLIQVPPADASVNVIVAPTHTVVGPPIAAGSGLTVIAFTAKQPTPTV
jgi:hypothetical protein